MTFTRLELFLLPIAALTVLSILELVRRGHLKEKYALLWLGVGVASIVLSLTRGVVDRIARAFGIAYGPTVVFVLAIVFLLLVCVHLSLEVSKLEERTAILASDLALLKTRTSYDDLAGQLDLTELTEAPSDTPPIA
jgi:hypothetical protein